MLEALGGDTLAGGASGGAHRDARWAPLFGLLTRLEMEDKIVSLPGESAIGEPEPSPCVTGGEVSVIF